MRYDNSLTTNVQDYIQNTLARKIADAHTRAGYNDAARDTRAYLSDPTTLDTPDFVIRRFIQQMHGELLPKDVDLYDLIQGKNEPWPESVLDSLATTLYHRTLEHQVLNPSVEKAEPESEHNVVSTTAQKRIIHKGQITISKSEWLNYLHGKGVSMREKVLLMAFVLETDVDTTLDLLLSFDMEPYSARNPLDLICMFCQQVPGKYVFSEAYDLYRRFMKHCQSVDGNDAAAPTDGMTRQIAGKLDQIFKESLTDADAKEALLKYMTDHVGEFPRFPSGQKQVFLPGYSRDRMKKFLRLAEYVAVLHPSYQIHDEKMKWKLYAPKPSAPVSLYNIASAAFHNCGWHYIIWDKNKKAQSEFESSMRIFVQNFEQHMAKVERLRNGKGHSAFVRRKDVLLFTFFLINGYVMLVESCYDQSGNVTKHENSVNKIREMIRSGGEMDQYIAQVLSKAVHAIGPECFDVSIGDRVNALIDCFNLILTAMGYMNLYLPSRFDRFVLLSLLSGDPDDLTPLIMSQEELTYAYSESSSWGLMKTQKMRITKR